MVNAKKEIKVFTILYFLICISEILCEYFLLEKAIVFLKPFITVFLVVLYLVSTTKYNKLYFLVMFFSFLTNVFFIPNEQNQLFYAIIFFTIHRLLIIGLVYKLSTNRDFITYVIATIPFLIVFYYVYYETPNIPENSILLLNIHNVLISIFAGIALSDYIMNDNKKNSILLISALLFVMLQFSVFIEKFYLTTDYSQIMRPISMSFNCMAFYAFYKYMIEAEKLNVD
jgi:hypothetical protein